MSPVCLNCFIAVVAGVFHFNHLKGLNKFNEIITPIKKNIMYLILTFHPLVFPG